jgi:hypothetical protein
MDEKQLTYYRVMLVRDRLLPIEIDGKFIGVITYYIGNPNEDSKYVRDDMWAVVDDIDIGSICYVDHLISTIRGHEYSRFVLRTFINHIKRLFPNVTMLRWNRYKDGKHYIYYKAIGGPHAVCH